MRPGLVLLDAACLVFCVWLAHQIRFAPFDRSEKWAEFVGHPGFAVFAMACLWALAAGAELYEPLILRSRQEVAARVVVVTLVFSTALAVATYAIPAWEFGRGLLALTCASWALLALTLRSGLAFWLARRPRPKALIVGEPRAVAEVSATLREHPMSPWEPVEEPPRVELTFSRRSVEGRAAVVVLAGHERGAAGDAGRLANLHFSGVPVVVASEVWAWLEGRLPLSELSPEVFLHQRGFSGIHQALFNRSTRALDLVLGTALLLLGLPLVGLAVLAILVFNGKPVFYRQARVGQYGRPFELLKLRTMRRDAEKGGPSFATRNDPRVTGVGAVLRRLRIDELPQLVNVLRGEMSLVGPRPERPEFTAELAHQIPFYGFRLAVPPGLTGWAQVSMPYARTVEEHWRRLEFDLFFIRERSLGLYLLTLLRTASAALAGVQS